MSVCRVSEADCLAPAGWSTGIGYATNNTESTGRTKCYVCGEPVCVSCSNVTGWYGKRVRACTDCIPVKEVSQ